MSSMIHFHTAFPQRTNFLPVLVWNGYSQEHHSMISTFTNAQMVEYWRGNGFEEVVLVDAKDFDDAQQPGPYVDSTQFSLEARLAFAQRVLTEMERAIQSALSGHLTVFILKQLKGAGVHAKGSKSHNLYAHHTLDHPDIVAALQARALHPAAWALVRQNCERAAGGPAAKVAVTESVRPLPPLGSLNLTEFPLGDKQVSTTAIGALVVQVGQKDPDFLVANADGNEASGLANVNQDLKVIHPTVDPLYNQQPQGAGLRTPERRCLRWLDRGPGALWRALPLVLLRSLCRQRLAHLADGNPGDGGAAPPHPFRYCPLHGWSVGTGTQRLDPPAAGN
jgi:phosphoketolase